MNLCVDVGSVMFIRILQNSIVDILNKMQTKVLKEVKLRYQYVFTF